MDHKSSNSPLRRARAQLMAAVLAVALVAFAAISSAPAATPRRTLAFARFLSAPPGQPGRLSSPTGMATDTFGNVFVADTGHDRVARFTVGGRYLGSVGGPSVLSQPEGVAVDAFGDVYVADTGHSRIVEFDPNGAVVRAWGSEGDGPGQFRFPTALTMEPGGDLYVADTGNGRVQRFPPAGGLPKLVIGSPGSRRGQFDAPSGVAVTQTGDVLVSDTGNDRVQVFYPTGAFRRVWGRHGSDPGRFDGPQGLAIDPAGAVLVADGGNDRVEAFTNTGRFLGQTQARPAREALQGPAGVATDCSGRVQVADGDGDRVASLRPADLITPAKNTIKYFHSYVAANAAIERVITSKRLVALTFDDGPSQGYTQRVLDILAAYRMHATFFLVGRWVQTFPQLVREEMALGHEIGNHTYDHPHLTRLAPASVTAELQGGTSALAQVGAPTPRWFRPPYGDFSGAISTAADALGQTTIGWHHTFDQYLLQDPSGGVADLLRNLRPGSIVLAHDAQYSLDSRLAQLPNFLSGLRRNCMTPTTVGDLLRQTGFYGVRTGGAAPGTTPSPGSE
ncbi:MAG TPA: polysaccharide deacetylase family protein [Solirubrobacteraceae bacterium]|nr:polysaccharide deacetylase family protein [Solirubrobacteraceae bacterium]